MKIDKESILAMLHGDGQTDQAEQAGKELPDQVDTDQHADLLAKFGINPADLIAKFTGGQGGEGSGLSGILGKVL